MCKIYLTVCKILLDFCTYYLRARYYSPSTGRFTQRDAYLGRQSDPLSLNRYTYCANNPVRYCDPTGRSPILAALLGAAAAAAVAAAIVANNVSSSNSSGGNSSGGSANLSVLSNTGSNSSSSSPAVPSQPSAQSSFSVATATVLLAVGVAYKVASRYVKSTIYVEPEILVPFPGSSLVEGTESEKVIVLQNRLNDLGYRDQDGNQLPGIVNFGPRTSFFIQAFMRENGLLEKDKEFNGIVDEALWNKIFSVDAIPAKKKGSLWICS